MSFSQNNIENSIEPLPGSFTQQAQQQLRVNNLKQLNNNNNNSISLPPNDFNLNFQQQSLSYPSKQFNIIPSQPQNQVPNINSTEINNLQNNTNINNNPNPNSANMVSTNKNSNGNNNTIFPSVFQLNNNSSLQLQKNLNFYGSLTAGDLAKDSVIIGPSHSIPKPVIDQNKFKIANFSDLKNHLVQQQKQPLQLGEQQQQQPLQMNVGQEDQKKENKVDGASQFKLQLPTLSFQPDTPNKDLKNPEQKDQEKLSCEEESPKQSSHASKSNKATNKSNSIQEKEQVAIPQQIFFGQNSQLLPAIKTEEQISKGIKIEEENMSITNNIYSNNNSFSLKFTPNNIIKKSLFNPQQQQLPQQQQQQQQQQTANVDNKKLGVENQLEQKIKDGNQNFNNILSVSIEQPQPFMTSLSMNDPYFTYQPLYQQKLKELQDIQQNYADEVSQFRKKISQPQQANFSTQNIYNADNKQQVSNNNNINNNPEQFQLKLPQLQLPTQDKPQQMEQQKNEISLNFPPFQNPQNNEDDKYKTKTNSINLPSLQFNFQPQSIKTTTPPEAGNNNENHLPKPQQVQVQQQPLKTNQYPEILFNNTGSYDQDQMIKDILQQQQNQSLNNNIQIRGVEQDKEAQNQIQMQHQMFLQSQQQKSLQWNKQGEQQTYELSLQEAKIEDNMQFRQNDQFDCQNPQNRYAQTQIEIQMPTKLDLQQYQQQQKLLQQPQSKNIQQSQYEMFSIQQRYLEEQKQLEQKKPIYDNNNQINSHQKLQEHVQIQQQENNCSAHENMQMQSSRQKKDQKSKKRQKQQKNKEFDPKSTKLNTSHVPINMLNNLTTYLIDFYKDHVPCNCDRKIGIKKPALKYSVSNLDKQTGAVAAASDIPESNQIEQGVSQLPETMGENAARCLRCEEYELLLEIKKDKLAKNLRSFQNIWSYRRMRLISEDYFIKFSAPQILLKDYRSSNNRWALYRSLPAFFTGVRKHKEFWKLTN